MEPNSTILAIDLEGQQDYSDDSGQAGASELDSTIPEEISTKIELLDGLASESDTTSSNAPQMVDGSNDEELRFSQNTPALRYISLCFMGLFSAYFTFQSMATSLFPRAGALSLAAVYFGYSLSCIYGPAVVNKFGTKWSLTISAALYSSWIASALVGWDWLLVVMAALLGLSGGPLWISQGTYVSDLAQGKSVGRYNSYFLALFYVSAIIGPICVGLLFLGEQSPTRTLISLAVLAVIGYASSIMMWFVKPVPQKQQHHHHSHHEQPSFMEKVRRMGALALEKRMMYLHTYQLYYGVMLAWSWGSLPRLVPVPWVPWLMLVYGVGVYLAAWQSGRVFDRFGWVPLLVTNLALATIGYGIAPIAQTNSVMWPLFISAFCFGAIEAVGTNLIQSTILKNYDQHSVPDALGIFRTVSGLGTALGMLSGLDYVPLMIICFFLLAIGAPLFAYHEIESSNATAGEFEPVRLATAQDDEPPAAREEPRVSDSSDRSEDSPVDEELGMALPEGSPASSVAAAAGHH